MNLKKYKGRKTLMKQKAHKKHTKHRKWKKQVKQKERRKFLNNNNHPQEQNESKQENDEDNQESNEPESPKTRPSSTVNSTTRPNSRVASKSRPSSRTIETDENQNEKNKTPDPVIEGEGVIEGVVNGEDEVETLNNEGQNRRHGSSADSNVDVAALVESGNMEQLAALVLNGEGRKTPARNGSLRDLQAALDRRKFAIAKDAISPKGASPLHVAVAFGNTSIVRYLAGRFPETVQVIDDDGRTPLHYAAVLADNGHYYNLLIHLGADTRIQDKASYRSFRNRFGHTPEYYRRNQDAFSHRSLLKEFGAEEDVAEEIFADKVPEDTFSARKDLDDDDMLSVLERCYNVLHGRRSSNVSTSSAVTATSISSSTPVVNRHIKRFIFDTVKIRLTKLDHNLYDIIWPSVKKLPAHMSFRIALEEDFPLGIVAPDFYVYKVFREFLEPIIKDYNCIDLHQDLQVHPKSKFFESDSEDDKIVDVELDLDPHLKWIISGTLDATRNLQEFELPKSLNHGQLESVERLVTTVLLSKEVAKALYPLTSDEDIEEKGSGTYYTMNEVLEDPSEARVLLASNGLLVPLWNLPDSERLHGKCWPYGRGVFVNNSANLAVWINVLDHIRIVTCTSHSHPGNIGQIYSRMARIIKVLEKNLRFHFDEKLGYLSARPTTLGNTLQFNLTLMFPYLIKEPENLRHLCVVRGLTYHRTTNTSDIVRIGNQQCLGITELQCFDDFTTAVANILQLEKDLAMSNSLHIAAMFLEHFQKEKVKQRLRREKTYFYIFKENQQQIVTGSPILADDNNAVPANIDVVTIEPDENNSEDESAFNTASRDEHGQSMLHFAAARAHGRNALFQLLLETEINVAFRDELYRTARDISIQANIPENTEEIDRYVLYIATKGDTDKLVELLLDGYDHITDVVDDEAVPIVEAVSRADQPDTVSFLQSILAFEKFAVTHDHVTLSNHPANVTFRMFVPRLMGCVEDRTRCQKNGRNFYFTRMATFRGP
ncbi:hypothetical protein NQ318_021052 [Aromia moschata]|uniref:Arginine kinase n=1 Tax=Aromia moschata TaxID=1265417 RepID=A0AAV8Y8V9_9CUCU|nr:hypothetical protein NQ318_021052 [Aromia moschata]